MEKKLDDFEAVRILVQTLGGFDKNDQERIIRWAREKVGLSVNIKGGEPQQITAPSVVIPGSPHGLAKATDIKAFVASKNPISDNQFVATIAYYYRFEAPEDERKETITAEDLMDACRKVNRGRLRKPQQTLVNAHNAGLLDKAERGAYRINAVGENLVAMTLPGNKREPYSRRKPVKKSANKKHRKK